MGIPPSQIPSAVNVADVAVTFVAGPVAPEQPARSTLPASRTAAAVPRPGTAEVSHGERSRNVRKSDQRRRGAGRRPRRRTSPGTARPGRPARGGRDARSRGVSHRRRARGRLGLLGVLGRHECRAGDDEAERDEPGADRERAGADGLAEDEDAADDGGQVRGHRGEGDDLDARAELEAARGRVERDRAGERARSASTGSRSPCSGPSAWVRYLIATSETPNSAPAARPSSSPSARCRTRRCAEIARSAAPIANIAPSTAISAASDECCGRVAPLPVSPMTASPAAVIVTPNHCHRPRRKSKNRSARTARNTSPPESTACTIDSGARASAPTCSTHARIATSHPIANHLERNSAAALSERVPRPDRRRRRPRRGT